MSFNISASILKVILRNLSDFFMTIPNIETTTTVNGLLYARKNNISTTQAILIMS